MKICCVVYFPGMGGNFFKLCLALSKETVPYYSKPLETCSQEEINVIHALSAEQRKDIIQYKTDKDYIKVHNDDLLSEPVFYYENPRINDHYKWVITHNHTNHYQVRSQWFHKILYIELDLEKYGHWVENSYNHFIQFARFGNFNRNNNYKLTPEQQAEANECLANPMTSVVSMTNILSGVDGFVEEYLKSCETLEITSELEQAILYYKEWRALRVDPFI